MLVGKSFFAAIRVAAIVIVASSACKTVWAELPQPGDIVFGLNRSNASDTLELLRGPAVMGGGSQVADPWSTPFLQSLEFDNLGGILHNVNGNLLAIDFGNPTEGGKIFNLATRVDPAPGQLIGNTTGMGGAGLTLSRLSALSISPDNTKIAVVGNDSGRVIVYDYTPGDTMGAGAALSGGRESGLFTLDVGATQGTTWIDADTLVAFSANGDLLEVDPVTMNTSVEESVITPQIGSSFTSLTYNPEVSPYLYGAASGFNTTLGSMSRLYIFDPNDEYRKIQEIDLSASSETSREIALDADGNLFIGGFGGTIDFIPDVVTNPTLLTDNSSIDWYESETGNSFNGFDIGFGEELVGLAGDYNGDNVVDAADYTVWRDNVGAAAGTLPNDVDGGTIGQPQYETWVSQFGSAALGAGSSTAVPEPSTLVLLGASLLALGLSRRR